MAVNFKFKDKYQFNDLVEIVRILREPGGCPWDMEQTHQSIRENFLEETYEVIEAIDTNNKELMQEELGDVLLQVLMHSETMVTWRLSTVHLMHRVTTSHCVCTMRVKP